MGNSEEAELNPQTVLIVPTTEVTTTVPLVGQLDTSVAHLVTVVTEVV